MKKLFVVACVLATSLLACGKDTPTLTVGALYPTEGSQSAGGSEELRGAQLAADWANDHGGVHGRRIVLKTAGVSRPEEVPTALRGLEHDGVNIVVGSHGSAVSAAAAQVATEDNLVFFETGAVGEVPPVVDSGKNFFRLAPMGANLGESAIQFARDRVLPAKNFTAEPRYAVAYVDDVYGRAVAGGAIDEAKRSPGTVAGTFPYQATGTDFDALAKQIGDAHPDVLFVAAYVDDGVALQNALVDAHVPLIATLGTSSSFCMPEFGSRLGQRAVGVFASDKPDAAGVNPSGLTPEGRDALAWAKAQYRDRYHEDMSAYALSGFSNGVAVFSHILPASTALDSQAVAAAALQVKLPEGSLANGGGLDLGAPGSVSPGENKAAAGVIGEWIAPNTMVVVWPPAMAEHDLVLAP